ncbi:RNA polymerase sigma factor [Brevibacillus marinus]|mgnify:CR=1 FL=1|uniref:RNA polymerase sigma factor n=1 Tax=Brevibacillus marinus TaxID=2496837 RepID=UPI0019D318FF|nr:sigma-70 family RNA polymerase sigma factor [Brevibacillus marinus]
MSHQDVDEKRLLRDITNGSAAAFAQFYEQYASLVLHIALRIVGDQMEAEDICHDIFLEVWKKADQYDPQRGSVEAWLAVKARTRALDRLRRKQRIAITPVDHAGIEPSTADVATEERVFTRLDREALLNALSKIPSSQARAVHGVYYEEHSHRELSAKMNRPLGTVKSLIRYGLDNLRKQLCQLGWLEPSGGAKKHE